MRKSQITKKKKKGFRYYSTRRRNWWWTTCRWQENLHFWLSSIRHNDAECQKDYTTGTFEFWKLCREKFVLTRISPNGNRFRLRSALRQRDQLWLLRILHWTEPLRHSRWQHAKSRQRRKQPTVSSPSATLLQPCEPVCTYACSGCVRSLRELFGRREDRFEDARWQIAEMTAAGLTTRLAVR